MGGNEGKWLHVVTGPGNCRVEFKVDWLALESLLVACLGKEELVGIGVCGCGSTGRVRQALGPLQAGLARSFL